MNRLKSALTGSVIHHRFIQLWAVALVFFIFASLFFAMAMVDLTRLEALLFDTLKKKAHYIVEGIEKTSQDKYDLLMHAEEFSSVPAGGSTYEEALVAQELVARALIGRARHISRQEELQRFSPESLLKAATAENLFAIAILDAEGKPDRQSGPIPMDLLDRARTLIERQEAVAIQLFGEGEDQSGLGFIGIRQHQKSGGVLLVLDTPGLRHWAMKVAVREAVTGLHGSKGVVYFAVEETGNRSIAWTGSIPEQKVEECLLISRAAVDSDSHSISQCVKIGETKFLEISFPFRLNGNAVGVARVGLETQETDQLLMENRRHIFVWTGLMALVGLFAMGVLYYSQNRHISKLQAMRERLHQAEKLSSLARLGAGVAHEIRNPLNAISLATQRLEREFAPPEAERTEAFNRITFIMRDEIKRLNGIIEDFLGISRGKPLDLRQHPIVNLLDRIVFLISEEAEAKGVHVEEQWANFSPSIFMDTAKMEQALLNIVKNAMDAIPAEGTITISLEQADKDWVSLTIQDSGNGIAREQLPQIFDHYYTTKKSGVGLGLSIANEIISAHGGEIRVTSEPGKGASFEVLLPLGNQIQPSASRLSTRNKIS